MPEKIWIAKRSNATQWFRTVVLAAVPFAGREETLGRVAYNGDNRGEMVLTFNAIA